MPIAVNSTLLGAYFGFVSALGVRLHGLLTAGNTSRGSILSMPPVEVIYLAGLVIKTLYGAFIAFLCTGPVAIILHDKDEGSSIRQTIIVHSLILLGLPWMKSRFGLAALSGSWIAAALLSASFVVTMALVSTRDGTIYIPYGWPWPFRRARKIPKNTGN